jgi:hypothetical protein
MAAILHGSQYREDSKLRVYLDETEVHAGFGERRKKQKHYPRRDTAKKLDRNQTHFKGIPDLTELIDGLHSNRHL